MDQQLLMDLFTKANNKKIKPIRTKLFLSDGTIVESTKTATASLVGAFDGKVGSMVRSRKGRSYRKPNGQRFYSDVDSTHVVAYSIKAT